MLGHFAAILGRRKSVFLARRRDALQSSLVFFERCWDWFQLILQLISWHQNRFFAVNVLHAKVGILGKTSRHFAVVFLPKKKLLFVARHRDTLQSAFCQQKQVFCYKKLKHNSSKQLKNKIIGERWPRSFSSKCSKQVELLHIIPGLYYIFDGKIMIYCGGKKWDLRWISCPAFMSDNLSCSHMISIKVLNNVKSFIFNGLSAMSHLLQRAGVFSHSDQVWRWPFQGIISARLSWVWTPRSSHVETKIRAKCCISVFHQAPC